MTQTSICLQRSYPKHYEARDCIRPPARRVRTGARVVCRRHAARVRLRAADSGKMPRKRTVPLLQRNFFLLQRGCTEEERHAVAHKMMRLQYLLNVRGLV